MPRGSGILRELCQSLLIFMRYHSNESPSSPVRAFASGIGYELVFAVFAAIVLANAGSYIYSWCNLSVFLNLIQYEHLPNLNTCQISTRPTTATEYVANSIHQSRVDYSIVSNTQKIGDSNILTKPSSSSCSDGPTSTTRYAMGPHAGSRTVEYARSCHTFSTATGRGTAVACESAGGDGG